MIGLITNKIRAFLLQSRCVWSKLPGGPSWSRCTVTNGELSQSTFSIWNKDIESGLTVIQGIFKRTALELLKSRWPSNSNQLNTNLTPRYPTAKCQTEWDLGTRSVKYNLVPVYFRFSASWTLWPRVSSQQIPTFFLVQKNLSLDSLLRKISRVLRLN